MNASPEILELLQDIINGKYSRASMARWLAENSLRFYESPNELDSMIVADLDAVLGEIQQGTHDEEFLVNTAEQLVAGLGLILPNTEFLIGIADSPIIRMSTSSTNSGGESMAVAVVEEVQSLA